MRKIKFRAWDKRENKMISWEQIIHNTSMNLFGGLFELFRREEFLAQQFTGLLDKNGTEIYEGDVVRILYTDWMSKLPDDERTIDQYLKDIAEVKVVIWSYNGFYVSHEIDGYAETMEYGRHGYIEVIGNIHENPELLNN